MKFEMHVISATDTGDALRIRAQGKSNGDPNWARCRVVELDLPSHEKVLRTFHVGRRITLDIKGK